MGTRRIFEFWGGSRLLTVTIAASEEEALARIAHQDTLGIFGRDGDVQGPTAPLLHSLKRAGVLVVKERALPGPTVDEPWTPFEPAELVYPDSMPEDVREQNAEWIAAGWLETWKNSVFTALKYHPPILRMTNMLLGSADMVWLSIRRNDRSPVHDWRLLQRVKDELVGVECEGFELYPARSRVVDESNQYHLFVYTDPTVRAPFGYRRGSTGTPEEAAQVGARQRGFDNG